jgi:hypothetical protein
MNTQRRVRAVLVAAALWPAAAAWAGSNLVVNGSFDVPQDPLRGWRTRYELPGESWYAANYQHVSVVDKEGPQRKVLALWGDYAVLQVPGQGTKVDSAPIPISPGGRYRFSARARSTGPDCRIMIEAYQWKPGIKPHPNPAHHELRLCYKFSPLYYGAEEGGTSGGVGPAWKHASMTFPDSNPQPLQKTMLDKIRFLVVHIVAIKGSEGYLYVDDVSVERLP